MNNGLLIGNVPILAGTIFFLASDPAIAKIPVIVLSAMAKTEPLFKRYGVKSYLVKPLNTQELLEKIQAIVPA